MATPLSHASRIVRAYLARGEDGLSEIADRLEERAGTRPGGKFGKREADYLPQTPVPPNAWQVRCERCRFYHDGEPGEPATCHIVGNEGDPYGGEAIHPRGWCAYWMPPAGEPAFAWIEERLRPDGASSARGKYRPRPEGPAGEVVTIEIEEGGDD